MDTYLRKCENNQITVFILSGITEGVPNMNENTHNSGAKAPEGENRKIIAYRLLRLGKEKRKKAEQANKPPVRPYYDMNVQQFNELVREQKKKVES